MHLKYFCFTLQIRADGKQKQRVNGLSVLSQQVKFFTTFSNIRRAYCRFPNWPAQQPASLELGLPHRDK
jgi:hypothetical protein